MTGTFAAVGVTNALRLLPQETLALTFSVAALEVFNGTVALEVSRNGGATWDIAKNPAGTALLYTGEQAADFAVSTTVLNDTPFPEHYRLACRVFDAASDDLLYSLATVDGDVIATLLVDRQGRPVLQLLDNGGIRVVGGLTVAGALSLAASAGAIAPTSIALASGVVEKVDIVTISAANIIATTAGGFGHAAGYELLAAPGADVGAEFVSAVLVYDRATATYGNGGNITVNATGGSALTGLVSAANSVGNAADKVAVLRPLTTAAEVLAPNVGFSLVSSAAFTNPGTAAGVIRVAVRYRLHTLGLT